MTDTDTLQLKKAHIALTEAPALAAYLRVLATPTDGRTDPGESIKHERIPIPSRIIDDSNQFYAVLVEWVLYWAQQLEVPSPSIIGRWRPAIAHVLNTADAEGILANDDIGIIGLPGMCSPTNARLLTSTLTLWLLAHESQIAKRPFGTSDYLADIADRVWDLRRAYDLTRERPLSAPLGRPCESCGLQEVHVLYFGATMHAAQMRGDLPLWHLEREQRIKTAHAAAQGIEIVCEYCGHEVARKPSSLALWLS